MKEIEFLITEDFKRDYKRLSKKYPSIDNDLQKTRDLLKTNPLHGVLLFGGFRKIRMSISSKGKGKSGGARIITFNYMINELTDQIIFVCMYDKNETSSITETQIKNSFKTFKNDIK